MSPSIQIVFDCADPHRLARFWAAAAGYEVEDHHDMIEGILAAGHAAESDTVRIDGRRAWRDYAACRDPERARPRLLFQAVPEPKTVKDRIHLDLHVLEGDERREEEVARLVGLGATRLFDGQLGPQRWVTMADPEGNEFCLA